ncbi:hypothetical protein KDA_08260 [Dictyobacter alpinus]|uniref:Uncharacterized protein n=1 Tax=Dictyobacter alpinus TaxID=2014873 RepID=A0A402B1W3_9CHLR|nr:hypothetical protein [Dictyobacter alpinus]GCE25342.1 hypothetical protein KDA_08260 [Dictyobacter alpinus]
MYVYYILRGTQQQQPVELDGDVTEEEFPGLDRTEGPDIIKAVIKKLADEGTTAEWTECDLTNEYYDRDDTYVYAENVYAEKRWIRRSDVPLGNTRQAKDR